MRTRILTRVLAAVMAVLVIVAAGCANTRPATSVLLKPIPGYGAAPVMRVKLAGPSSAASAVVEAGKVTVTLDGERLPFDGRLELRPENGRVSAGELGSGSVVAVEPVEQPEHFSINGRTYRGSLRFTAAGGGWDVVNLVDLEQYVAGVIGWEMMAGWPVEALKAQAVASRTYALFVMEEARDKQRGWDLDDTTAYQVYGGVGPSNDQRLWRETPNVLAAREQTTGQVLTYDGKGFKAFFHSTSGGHTVDPRAGFGIDEVIEPLAGVDLGEFSKDSPKFRWETRLDDNELTARLIEARIQPSRLIRMEAAQTAPGGHATRLKLFDSRGHNSEVGALELRKALGLPSTSFEAAREGDTWVFRGRGYGHGVGLCQWSAKGMAVAGWDAYRILKTMYPGAEVKAAY